MSREFRHVGSGYFHSVLLDAARPEGGEARHRISRALSDIYAALAPLEYASASFEAQDSGPARVVLALQEHHQALREAFDCLDAIRREDAGLIESVLQQVGGKS